MSAYNHVLCSRCFYELAVSEGRSSLEPVRMIGALVEPCCRCGKDTDAGIFMREEPGKFACEGKTGTHVPKEEVGTHG